MLGPEVKRKLCNCKNSKCLKLYCECFAAGIYCNGCNCHSCCNNPANDEIRRRAIDATLERNPSAFRPKIAHGQASHAADGSSGSRHNKGCHCKKSSCLKKYCECYQAGILCTGICKCIDCKNFEGSNEIGSFGRAGASVSVSSAGSGRRTPSPPAGKRPRLHASGGARAVASAALYPPYAGVPFAGAVGEVGALALPAGSAAAAATAAAAAAAATPGGAAGGRLTPTTTPSRLAPSPPPAQLSSASVIAGCISQHRVLVAAEAMIRAAVSAAGRLAPPQPRGPGAAESVAGAAAGNGTATAWAPSVPLAHATSAAPATAPPGAPVAPRAAAQPSAPALAATDRSASPAQQLLCAEGRPDDAPPPVAGAHDGSGSAAASADAHALELYAAQERAVLIELNATLRSIAALARKRLVPAPSPRPPHAALSPLAAGAGAGGTRSSPVASGQQKLPPPLPSAAALGSAGGGAAVGAACRPSRSAGTALDAADAPAPPQGSPAAQVPHAGTGTADSLGAGVGNGCTGCAQHSTAASQAVRADGAVPDAGGSATAAAASGGGGGVGCDGAAAASCAADACAVPGCAPHEQPAVRQPR